MTDRNSRRKFLHATGSASLLVTPLARAMSGASMLAEIDIDPDAARAVAEFYLDAYPDERDTGRLLASIAHVDNFNVKDLIQSDFSSGKTVNVDGWILSRTEARLCAAAALNT